MANKKLDNSRISKHLGQTSQYKSKYDAKLLVKEPRSNNREYLDIFDDNLPFVGSDTWNAYECSFLLNSGKPVTGIVKINYPCDSKYIVESKSIKLYLNSYNMTKLGNTETDAVPKFQKMVKDDLSNLLETDAKVSFQFGNLVNTNNVSAYEEWDIGKAINVDVLGAETEFDCYTENPDLLEIMDSDQEQFLYSGLLKSNCRVTSQPDWGDVVVYINGDKVIEPNSFLKYVVSFRDECHFHEEICECIYKRIYDKLKPKELLVMCLYARRGGIDINPVRASDENLIKLYANNLVNVEAIHVKTSKQ